MTLVFPSLIAAFVFFAACAHVSDPSLHGEKESVSQSPATSESGPPLWRSCTLEQAEQWSQKAEKDPRAAMKGASCYAVLARQGQDRALRLAHAKEGRRLAQNAIAFRPDSGLAHYLAAYLTGLEAENDPLRGLELVPIIEHEALLASQTDPGVDHGGPDRMLGELYLRAPGPPMSVGDTTKSITHYRRAVTLAPAFHENRLGLVEALLAEGETVEACLELHKLLGAMKPENEIEPVWERTSSLLERLCDMQE